MSRARTPRQLRLFASFVLSLTIPLQTAAQEEDVVDFSDKITSHCDVIGLHVPPPPDWFTMPIEETPEGIAGCMMMLADDEDLLLGILRVMSVSRSVDGFAGPDFESILGLEIVSATEMGYQPEDLLWKRDSVPVAGEGFETAQALGLSASVEGNPVGQEIHFLTFQNTLTQYVVTLLTPSKVDGPEYYQRNTEDFGTLIRSFQFTQE